jgi:geranylgeranyl reductase family protein
MKDNNGVNETYDVIVVGAGPSGSVCAHDCAREGLEVLLLERGTFPRDKPCGGAMYATILEKYPGLEGVADRRVQAVRTYLNHEPVATQRRDTLLFRRTRLDEHLARRAQGAGVHLLEGIDVRKVQVGSGSVTVTDVSGEEFRGSVLVDASGANGILFRDHKATAREALRYRIVSIVLEAPCPNSAIEERMGFDGPSGPTCYNAYLETGFVGYGWLFPKDGMMNAGMGTITELGHGLRERFSDFLERTGFIDLDRTSTMAFTIPTAVLPRLWLPRVLFVGDAGGFVDALTGGGLIHGIRSAEFAAGTAVNAVRTGDFSGTTMEDFERRCTQLRRNLGLRTTGLYLLAGAVRRGLDRPFAVRTLLRSVLTLV